MFVWKLFVLLKCCGLAHVRWHQASCVCWHYTTHLWRTICGLDLTRHLAINVPRWKLWLVNYKIVHCRGRIYWHNLHLNIRISDSDVRKLCHSNSLTWLSLTISIMSNSILCCWCCFSNIFEASFGNSEFGFRPSIYGEYKCLGYRWVVVCKSDTYDLIDDVMSSSNILSLSIKVTLYISVLCRKHLLANYFLEFLFHTRYNNLDFDWIPNHNSKLIFISNK